MFTTAERGVIREIITFALLGLGTGTLIAGLALSVVLTYRGSGIINMAAGAVAMVAGYSFWSLQSGTYGFKLGTALAIVVTLVVSVLVGVLIEVCAFRPLRTATPLAKLVSSLGVFLVLQATVVLAFGTTPESLTSILPTNALSVFGLEVPEQNFILAGIVIVIAVVLAAVYRWTRFGLATRAASENEVSGMFAGLSPNRLSLVNTMLGSLVAGIVAIVAAPIIQLDPVNLPLQIVPALAAALFARFTSFGVACFAGLAIGALENILYYLSTLSWFPTDQGASLPGIDALLVLVVMLIALFWRGASLPSRGELLDRAMPAVYASRRTLRYALIAAVVGGVALVVFPYDFRQALINSLITVVITLSLVVLAGYVGQLSIVQLALSGITGIIVSHLAVQAGIGFPFGPLIGAVSAMILGVGIAISALRVRGVSLVVVTLAATVALQQFVFANTTLGGGTNGARIPAPELFGLNFGTHAGFRGLDGQIPSATFGFFVLAVTIIACLGVARLPRMSFGARMLAVRSNERAAAAAGINVRTTKIVAFALSSFLAGVAGALFGYDFNSVTAASFDPLAALTIVAFAYVGGITMISGALIAGLLATQGLSQYAFQIWFGISGSWVVLFGGITLITNLVVYPDGIAGGMYRKSLARRASAATGGNGDTPARRFRRPGVGRARPNDTVPS